MRTNVKWIVAACVAGLAANAQAGTVVLKKAFIEKYKNRATIDATFIVDHAHKYANSIKDDGDDGDLHASGRSAEVGLPMVAEIVNARSASQKDVVAALKAGGDSHQASPISGAWRLWFEHPSTQPQVQFDPVKPAANTNPPHCFEIHPILTFAGQDASNSFQPIPGFHAYDAETAFSDYDKLSMKIQVQGTSITLESKRADDNYVEFFALPEGKPAKLDDGGKRMLATALKKSHGDAVENHVSLVFVPGTAPLEALNKATAGEEMHLLGIPRVDLHSISTFVKASGPGISTRQLPYEIIVVAVLK